MRSKRRTMRCNADFNVLPTPLKNRLCRPSDISSREVEGDSPNVGIIGKTYGMLASIPDICIEPIDFEERAQADMKESNAAYRGQSGNWMEIKFNRLIGCQWKCLFCSAASFVYVRRTTLPEHHPYVPQFLLMQQVKKVLTARRKIVPMKLLYLRSNQ